MKCCVLIGCRNRIQDGSEGGEMILDAVIDPNFDVAENKLHLFAPVMTRVL